MEAPTDGQINSKCIKIHRLFYVDHGDSKNDDEHKIAVDSQSISKVITTLYELNPSNDLLFGVFGEKAPLQTCLDSLFPDSHNDINFMFSEVDSMPAIWIVCNDTQFTFVLILPKDVISEKGNYFIVVMQRFLQDICRNILICPSNEFFSSFSAKNSFQSNSFGTITVRTVKKERIDVQMTQKVPVNDHNILTTLLSEQHGHILPTNNTRNAYCFKKTIQNPAQNSADSNFNKLKEALQVHLNSDNLTLGAVLRLFQQYNIFLSQRQKTQIETFVSQHITAYSSKKSVIYDKAHSMIKELLGISNRYVRFITGGSDIDSNFKKQLYSETTDWLLNPMQIEEIAPTFSSRLTAMIYSHKAKKYLDTYISSDKVDSFISELKSFDQKKKVLELQDNLIQSIYETVTSENQSDIHFDIQQLYYNPIYDSESRLQCLDVVRSTIIQISPNDLGRFIDISHLSQSDRLDFSKKVEFVACFKMNDDKNDIIIIIKRPAVTKAKLGPERGYTVLSYKNGAFRRVTDYHPPKLHFAYAFGQNTHTLVTYNTDSGNVTKHPLDESTQIQNSYLLFPQGSSPKPNGVKSLALTASQDLLILIDSTSNVYEFDISKENVANVALLVKKTSEFSFKSNFYADNNDLYETVQTIGEQNPVFFFQAKSCIDIISRDYSQLYSIKLEQQSSPYSMQVFADFVDTFCVLLNANANEVYMIQNLISDSRMEREESLGSLDKPTKQYIGNRLLDIIRRGEIQFGIPDLPNKTQYYFVLSSEYSMFADRINQYFESLDLKALLKIGYEVADLVDRSIHIERLIKTIISRIPLQLCTIEMGTLVPLNNGKRDNMDHLSSKTFQIEMKAREISFSYLENILNDIDKNIKIVGIIGRQSTGKSYLMNKIFRTRFAVSAGRCTDGIWISYAVLEDTHFIVLDCEGLFSDQRTEDEEIKLISFLAAVCDVTILSQDLGFSRFQDRLFSVLSQAVDKLGTNDKLFKGILLLAVRDISDDQAVQSTAAAEKKLFDLQKRGKSSFVEQIFSNTIKIQLLHHFENKNFGGDIEILREICLKPDRTDTSTSFKPTCRWENGRELADYMKILLVQLYTDDFIDPNERHADMKLVVLEEEMKRAWTRFSLNDDENIESKEQQIETEFENKPCLLRLNHTDLQLNESSVDSNCSNVREFILKQLHLVIGSSDKTNEETNKITLFVNELISQVMSYRRQQVKEVLLERFQKKFPNENDNIKERKLKFMNSAEQYMLSYKLQICLKKCSVCDLKCVNNAQHTEEIKSLLEEKKTELTRLQDSLKTTTSEDIEERIRKRREDLVAAQLKEKELQKERNCLSDELKYLSEKENLEANTTQCSSELAAEKTKIDDLTLKIDKIHQQLNLPASDGDLTSTSKLSQQLDEEMKLLTNADQYQIESLNKLIYKFHQIYDTDYPCKNELCCFSPKQEETNEIESVSGFQLNLSLLSKMMTENVEKISNYKRFIEECLQKIEEQLNTDREHVSNGETQIKEMEHQIVDAEKHNEEREKLIETTKKESEEFNKQLSEITVQWETLSKELEEEKLSDDIAISPEIKKIKYYIKYLQDKMNTYSSSRLNENEIDSKKKQEIKKLEFFLKEESTRKSELVNCREEISSLNEDTQVDKMQEQLNKNEQTLSMISEKIGNVQKSIKSLEEEQLVLREQESQNQQLNEELKVVNQLLESVYSYDRNIEAAQSQLLKAIEKKDKKERDIEKLKQDDPDDEDIQDEEEMLEKFNRKIADIQLKLTEITEEKTSTCNNNTLLVKVLNDPQYDAYQQQNNKQNRLAELVERSKELCENIERLKHSVSSEEHKFKDQNQELLNNKENLSLQKLKYNTHKQNVHSATQLNEVGTELFHLLREVETLLVAASEKLNKISETQQLIKEYMSSSDALTLAINERERLDALQTDLNQQLEAKKGSNLNSRYPSVQACKEQYDRINKDYHDTHSQTKILKEELSNMDIFAGLKGAIRQLEKKVQKSCHCGTDHKCSGICQICFEEDKTQEKKCMFVAGHAGDHKCNAGHICIELCEICEIYGFPKSRCAFAYEHTDPRHHKCEGKHQCPTTCVCSDPCTIPLELKQHTVHRCNSKDCWKPCMFSCGKSCATQDHNHDATTETVPMTVGTNIYQMKKHLCDQPHYCQGICDEPGICKLEYREEPRKWTTESGTEFAYDHIEVKAVRVKCGIKIDANESSHAGTKHVCGGQHTCTERCPDCGSLCNSPYGHSGKHKTNHRNKDQHIFTSTNPTERIEVLSKVEDIGARTYKIGESARPENCAVSCKRRGRSHYHLVECPGDSNCWGKTRPDQAKHSDDIYYYGPNNPSTKKYDQILCYTYWSSNKWNSPVSDLDQTLINKCNTYCEKHVNKGKNGGILKESEKGFCTLGAWHTGDHTFECKENHDALELYRGIDVCFVIDATGSMDFYFQKVKDTITRIMNENPEMMKRLKKSSSDFQFAVVDYRDHEPEADYLFHTCDFTTDTLAKDYITKLEAGSGGDFPEAVLDALDAAYALKWRDNVDRLLFHILDAPPHGRIFTDTTKGERWPDGCPCKKTAEGVLSAMKKQNIKYHVLPCSGYLKLMIAEFEKYIDVKTLTFDQRISFEDVIAKQVQQQLIDTETTLKKR